MRLKLLRKQKKISQLKLAMDLGMNQNSISRYENMEREADYATLILFADYFNVSIDYLVGRTDYNMFIKEEQNIEMKQIREEAETLYSTLHQFLGK